MEKRWRELGLVIIRVLNSQSSTATIPLWKQFFFSWAQGFMTGWNVATDDENLIDLLGMKAQDQKTYLRDYCDKHPLKNYLDGVVALMKQIRFLNARK
jgi:hypothetical protein